MLPRLTRTAAPAPWQMAVAIGAPIATTLCAWYERWAMAQAFWVLLLLVVMSFALRRFLPGDIPNSFVWVITALVFGIGGAILAGYGAATDATWLHDLGRGLVLQGMMTGLVIGVGGMLLPAITRTLHLRSVEGKLPNTRFNGTQNQTTEEGDTTTRGDGVWRACERADAGAVHVEE